LYNGSNKQNVFGLFYLFGACLVWVWTKKYEMKIMENVTNFTIMMLLLQYFLLLINLNQFTSPVPLPKDIMYSSMLALAYGSNLIGENQFIKALGFGFSISDSAKIIGDCMTFLILQLFVWTFVLRAEFILNRLIKILSAHDQVDEETKSQVQKDNAVRSPTYIYLKWIVNTLFTHSPRIVVVVMCAIAMLYISLSNFVLVTLFLFNIVFVDFILSKAHITMKMKFTKTLFKLTQISLLIFIVLFSLDQIPFNMCPVFRFSIIFFDKVLLFTILQVVVDLIQTEDYKKTLQRNIHKDAIRVR